MVLHSFLSTLYEQNLSFIVNFYYLYDIICVLKIEEIIMTYTVPKKKTEISYMNIFLCLLVVFIHVSSEPVSKLDKSGLPYIFIMVPWRLSAFVVQGFIFLSSLKIFLKPISHFDYLSFIKNRVKTILFPYIIWVMIYYLYLIKSILRA